MQIAEIEPQARRNLLKLAEVYCSAVRIGADKRPMRFTTLSRKASGDHRLFDALKAEERRYQAVGHRTNKKGSVTLRVYDQLILWFSSHWPPDTEFPELAVFIIPSERNHYGTPAWVEKSTKRTEKSSRSEKAPREQSGGRNEGGDASRILARLRRNVGDGQ